MLVGDRITIRYYQETGIKSDTTGIPEISGTIILSCHNRRMGKTLLLFQQPDQFQSPLFTTRSSSLPGPDEGGGIVREVTRMRKGSVNAQGSKNFSSRLFQN